MIEYPKILISGDYNAFNEGWNGCGVYMCSGNYKSDTFKYPIYIGSTEDLEDRITVEHIPQLNRNKHYNEPFQKSWNKRGKDQFIWYLLETCLPDEKFKFEQKYFDIYKPFVDEFGGFNIAKDPISPTKGRKASEETRKKLSESHLGQRSSPTTEFKKGFKPWNKGVPRPQETRDKISKANKGRKLPNHTHRKGITPGNAKKIECIELKQIFNSTYHAAKILNIKCPSSITSACKGRIKSCGGYTWRYAND